MTVRVTTLKQGDSEESRLQALNGFQRDVREALDAQPQHLFKELEIDGADTDVDVELPGLEGSPQAVYLAYVRDEDAGATLTSALSLHWERHEGGIRVLDFHGLSGGTTYTVRLHVVVGG